MLTREQAIRLRKLKEADETIRVAMLGEPETRHDLIDLRKKVHNEIRKITAKGRKTDNG